MKIAFFGDIVGKTGRKKFESSLQQYVLDEKVDFVVVNAENATAGAGLSATHAESCLRCLSTVLRWAITLTITKKLFPS